LRFGEHEDIGHDSGDRWFDSPPRSGGIGGDDPEPAIEEAPDAWFSTPPQPTGPARPDEPPALSESTTFSGGTASPESTASSEPTVFTGPATRVEHPAVVEPAALPVRARRAKHAAQPPAPAIPPEPAGPGLPADSGASWFNPASRPEPVQPSWEAPDPPAWGTEPWARGTESPGRESESPDWGTEQLAPGTESPAGYTDPSPTRAEPLLRNPPTRADPLLSNPPTRADPLLSNPPTRADPLLSNPPTRADPLLSNPPTRADPLLRGGDTLPRDGDIRGGEFRDNDFRDSDGFPPAIDGLGRDGARRTPPLTPTDTPPRGEQASSSWAGVTRGRPPVADSPPSPADVNPGRKNAPPWSTMPVEIGPGIGMPGGETGPNGAANGTPFAGARLAGFSAPGAAQAAQAGTPRPFRRADTGNFRRQGQDTGAFRRIRDTGAMRAIMDTGAMRSLMDTAAFQALRDRYAGKGRVIAAIVIAGWVVLAGVGVFLAFGLRSEGNSATASSNPTTSTTHPGTASGSKSGTKKAAPPATVAALPVAKVIAWGPTGVSTAEHPEQGARVVDASAATAWHSRWYMKPDFPGAGLVLDMGKTVTVTGIKLTLAPGDADFLIRVGNTAKPGTLTKVASRSHSGGDVTIKLAKPSHGRYVELWITRLPRDSSGTYQELVYNVQVTGLT
jgi:hypothetical protein